MAFILNASSEEQHVVAFGNHFTLKPGQIKNFQEHIASFLATERASNGLVMLSDAFEDPEYKTTEEGKAALALAKLQGIAARVRKLKEIAYNNQVSLRQDLEIANIKADPRAFASDGEIQAMELLAKYQDMEADEQAKKVARVKELEKKIGKVER